MQDRSQTQAGLHAVAPRMRVEPGATLALRDGAAVEVRALQPAAGDGLAAAVARLSSQSRYLRFASPKPRLTARDLDALTDVDHHRREALLAIDPATRHGIAVARYAELEGEPGEPGAVDVALTVDDAWQGRGLGGILLARLLARARQEGHAVARASVLPENVASLAMLRRAGFRPRGWEGGLVELEL